MQSLSLSLSVSMVIWLPLSVRTQCEWAWYWLSSGRMYTLSIDKHTSTCESKQISPSNMCVCTQCEWAWYWLSGRMYIYIMTNIQVRARHLRGSHYRCSYLWLPLIFQQTSHLDCRGSSWDIKLAILLGLA